MRALGVFRLMNDECFLFWLANEQRTMNVCESTLSFYIQSHAVKLVVFHSHSDRVIVIRVVSRKRLCKRILYKLLASLMHALSCRATKLENNAFMLTPECPTICATLISSPVERKVVTYFFLAKVMNSPWEKAQVNLVPGPTEISLKRPRSDFEQERQTVNPLSGCFCLFWFLPSVGAMTYPWEVDKNDYISSQLVGCSSESFVISCVLVCAKYLSNHFRQPIPVCLLVA